MLHKFRYWYNKRIFRKLVTSNPERIISYDETGVYYEMPNGSIYHIIPKTGDYMKLRVSIGDKNN